MPHKISLSSLASIFSVTSALAGALGLATSANARPVVGLPKNVLYIESNNPIAGQNAVLAYHRNNDGSLTALAGSPFPTGGTGYFDPTYVPGPFDGQNVMAADPKGGVIFVPNGGSNNISAMRTAPDGSLTSIGGSPFSISGSTPEALGLRGRGLVVVNNAAGATQATSSVGPSYLTAYLDDNDRVHEAPSSTVQLPSGSLPTQALPSPFAPLIYTNEFGAGTLSSYFQDFTGRLHLVQRQAPPREASETVQPLPLGQDLNPKAPFLYVALSVANRLAIYDTNSFETKFVRSVPNSGKVICWVHVSKDGRTLYSSNTGDHSISVYDLSRPDFPVERQRVVLNDSPGGSFDFALSPDEKFIYVVEEESAAAVAGLSNKIHILSVDGGTGQLAEIAASPLKLPVAGSTRAQGLLVY